MLDTYKRLIVGQFEATFCTLKLCIDRCPDASWHEPVVNYKYCQAMFHALFYGDLYLGLNVAALRQQSFHQEHKELFGDYEELEDRLPASVYEKNQLLTYVQHCRNKSSEVMASETVETLNEVSGFEWLPFSRAEVHVYNIRHLQHHAAQLSMRLRIDHGEDVPWVKTGWRLEP